MLRRAARRGLTCVQARAERLPFPDGAFDRILIHDALHHFQDTESTLSEVARVLASAGMAVFEEPDVETRTGRFIAAAERMCGFRSRFLPSSALIALLRRQQGLECRIVRRIGFRTRILARHAAPS